MANFCSECGSALTPGARFCAVCGAGVPDSAGEAVQAGPAAAPAAPAAAPSPVVHPAPVRSEPAPDPAPAPAPASRKGLLIGGGALLAVAIAGGAWLGLSSTDKPAETGSEAASGASDADAKPASLFAVAEANLRDTPSLEGSKIVGSLKRGEKVNGVIVNDDRGKPWLKIDGSGRFVSLANLAETQPPALANLDGSDRITTAQCTILAAATAAATTKTVLKSGAAIRLVGSTADGFGEVGLPGGGVGYTAPSAGCITDPSPAKGAVANRLIQLDPRSCDLGTELEPYYEKARAARDSGAIEELEEEYSFPVDKRFQGLRVTSVILGSEWQGVAFGDPLNKVQATFRKLGFTFEKDGTLTVPADDYPVTTLRAAIPAMKKRGLTELICSP